MKHTDIESILTAIKEVDGNTSVVIICISEQTHSALINNGVIIETRSNTATRLTPPPLENELKRISNRLAKGGLDHQLLIHLTQENYPFLKGFMNQISQLQFRIGNMLKDEHGGKYSYEEIKLQKNTIVAAINQLIHDIKEEWFPSNDNE